MKFISKVMAFLLIINFVLGSTTIKAEVILEPNYNINNMDSSMINSVRKEVINRNFYYFDNNFYDTENEREIYEDRENPEPENAHEDLNLSVDTSTNINIARPIREFFLDERLAQAVATHMGKNINDNVTEEDLRGVTGLLNAGARGINNIEGIQYLTNITSLQLATNNISNLEPLKHLNNLTVLGLANNGIQDINEIKYIDTVIALDLDHNQISNLEPLRDMHNLRLLNLVNNEIVNVEPISQLNLEWLNLNRNQISNLQPLTVSHEMRFTALDQSIILPSTYDGTAKGIVISTTSQVVPNNRITFNPIGGSYYPIQSTVTWGGVGENSLSWNETFYNFSGTISQYVKEQDEVEIIQPKTFLDFFPDEDLARVIASRFNRPVEARVTEQELGQLRGDLYANHRNIRNIEGLQYLTRIEGLYLYNNNITDLSPLEELTNLKTLSLVNNSQLSNLEPLRNLTNLQNLGFSFNRINDVEPLKDLTNLETLSIINNQVDDAEPLRGLTNLQVLNLSGNLITDLSPLNELSAEITATNQRISLEPTTLGEATQVVIRTDRGEVPGEMTFNPAGGSYNAETGLITWASSGNNTLRWSDANFSGTITQYVEERESIEEKTFSDFFPDENLARGIAITLRGSSATSQDIVTLQELNDFTGDIHIQRASIRNLEGMQHLTSVTSIDLYDNQISDISPLSGLKSVYTLRLSNNEISDFRPLNELHNTTIEKSNQTIELPTRGVGEGTVFNLYNRDGSVPDISIYDGVYENGLISWNSQGVHTATWKGNADFSGTVTKEVRETKPLLDAFGEPLRYNTEYYIYYLPLDFRPFNISRGSTWDYVVVSNTFTNIYVPTFIMTPAEHNSSSETYEIMPNDLVSIKTTGPTNQYYPYLRATDNDYVRLHDYDNSHYFRLDKGDFAIDMTRGRNHFYTDGSSPIYLRPTTSGKVPMGEFRFVPTDLKIRSVCQELNNDLIFLKDVNTTSFTFTNKLGDGQRVEIYSINERGLETLVSVISSAPDNYDVTHPYIYGASGYVIRASNHGITSTQVISVHYEN